MFCPGRRVSRLTAIRGKSLRRSRSRRCSRDVENGRTAMRREKLRARTKDRKGPGEKERDGEDEHICTRGARYREPFSLILRD